jgi:hypothetical protein
MNIESNTELAYVLVSYAGLNEVWISGNELEGSFADFSLNESVIKS